MTAHEQRVRLDKVLLIGAQGALGRLCVDPLRSAGFEVARAGRRGAEGADFRHLDLDDDSAVEAACAEADLVVSTVRHPRLTAERAVLRNGGALLSLASLSLADRRRLVAESEGAKGLVVLHAGLAPGVYTLMLKDMLREHPEADGVVMAAAWSLVQTSGPAAMIDFGYPAMKSAPRRPTQVIDFPEPIGPRRCLYVGGPEIGFFGGLAEGCDARIYACWTQRGFNLQVLLASRLGLLARFPLAAYTLGRRWTQQRTSHEHKRDLVMALQGRRCVASQYVAGDGDYLMTAASAVAFTEALREKLRKEPALRGAVGAEELFDLEDVRPGLEGRGMQIARQHG